MIAEYQLTRSIDTLRNRAIEHHVPLLLVLTLALFPFSLSNHVPLALLAGSGLHRLYREPGILWSTPAAKLLTVVFLLLWLPPLLALVHAVNPERAIPSTLRLVAFPLAGIAVVHYARSKDCTRLLYLSLFGIVTFWVADALLQFLAGHNLLGYPQPGDQINGLFDSKMRLGVVLAHLAPFYLEALRRMAVHRPLVWLLVIPFCIVVLLAGSRSGWFTLLIALIAYGAYLVAVHRTSVRHLAAFTVLIMLAGAVVVMHHSGLQHRLDKTVALATPEFTEADRAVTERIDAWQAALQVMYDDWLIGVGIRGFEVVAVERGYVSIPFNHPHMFVLDIVTSAGVVGLIGYLLVLGLIAGLYRVVLHETRSELFAPWLAVGLMLFPFNAHWGFYATYSSSLIWFVLLLALALTSAWEHRRSSSGIG